MALTAPVDWQVGWMMGGLGLLLFYWKQNEHQPPPNPSITPMTSHTDTIPVYREVALRKCPGHRELEQRVAWLTIAVMLLAFALLSVLPM